MRYGALTSLCFVLVMWYRSKHFFELHQALSLLNRLQQALFCQEHCIVVYQLLRKICLLRFVFIAALTTIKFFCGYFQFLDKRIDYYMQSATVYFILKEAKMRILWMIFCFFITSATCYWFSQELFFALSTPFLKISKTSFFICTQITESLNTYIIISIILGFFFCIPYILYQIWCFFIPSYNKIQRTCAFKIIILCLVAVFLSLIFTFTWVLPNIWLFLYKLNNTATGQQFFIIQLQPKIYDFSILTLRLLSFTALCSQIPIVVIYCIQYNIITIDALIKRRRSCAFISILLAALITPPDVWCQLSVCLFIFFFIEMAVFLAIVQDQYSTRVFNKINFQLFSKKPTN